MKAVQIGSFAVITQKCNKTANINVKILQFIHKLTASDTSKTAKNHKKVRNLAVYECLFGK